MSCFLRCRIVSVVLKGWITFSMKILLISFVVFLAKHSVLALSCHKCPSGSTYADCVKNIATEQCTAGYNQCFTMKIFVKQSSGEEISYLEKQCGLDFICNKPDPNYVCNIKNLTLIGQGHIMANCTSRCCIPDMCNNDDLPPGPSTPPPATTASPSLSVNANDTVPRNSTSINATVPSPPQTGATSTPAGCGSGSINKPLRMTIVFAAVIQLAFKMM